MEENIKFSIIVPIYNIEKYIQQCIDSLVSQKYRNIEIILVDDGSQDTCARICDNAAKSDSRIVVIHKKNGGLVSARKAGAKCATGEYITCVDGDDYVSEEYISYFADTARRYAPDIIMSGCYDFRDGELIRTSNVPVAEILYQKEDIEKRIFPILISDPAGRAFPWHIMANAYKRDLYIPQQMAVSDRIAMGEDFVCTSPCFAKAETIWIGNKCNYYYRYNPESMTKVRKAFDWENPRLRAEHFRRQIDMDKLDFEAQLYRRTVQTLFSVAVSQFNLKKPYFVIANDIRKHLKDKFYMECIWRCRFRFPSKGFFACQALKYRLCFVMKLYNCFHKKK